MPSTPVYGIPYPADADPPDGPGQMQALAEAVETALAAIERPESGVIPQTADRALPTDGSTVDVTGAQLIITPDVPIWLDVIAVFYIQALDDSYGTAPGKFLVKAEGLLNVDGSVHARKAAIRTGMPQGSIADFADVAGTQAQVYRLNLNTSTHTIKMQARKTLGSDLDGIVYAEGTAMMYRAIPQ